MRRTLALTLAVLVCALAACGGALWVVEDTVSHAEELADQAVRAEAAGQSDRAAVLLDALEDYWDGRSALLETMTSHDDLHDVGEAVALASICLACGDHDDFLCSMATACMALEHLLDEQRVSWKNLC